MNVDMFSYMEETEAPLREQRVNIALKHRLGKTVASFTSQAQSPEELHERISLVAPAVRITAKAVADEYEVDYSTVVEAAFKLLADHGDTYQQETKKLKGHDDGAGDVGSPKIDKGKYDPFEGLPEIDVDSKRHHRTKQDVSDAPTETDWHRHDIADGGNMIKSVDADKPIGDTEAIHTQVWTADKGNSAGQAKPVTTEARYRVVD